MSDRRFRFQFSLRMLLAVIFAFALGFAARNLASGLHPLAMQLSLPSSTTPVRPGDSLIVECLVEDSLSRRVTVLADNTITLPYVGTVNVAGQNPDAIARTLTTSYQQYLSNPTIQVYRADVSEPLD